MKIFIVFFFIVNIGLISCNQKQSSTDNNSTKLYFDPKIEIGKINEFFKKYEEPSQIFVTSGNKFSKVKGKHGTIISIDPSDLITENGQPMGRNILVELKELINQNQLLRTNTQTVSNEQLLISGGAYYINMTSEGQQLKLKKDKTLSVEFPKLSDMDMTLFYGQRDSLGRMNWFQADQKLRSKPKPSELVKTVPKQDSGRIILTVNGIESTLGHVKNRKIEPLTKNEKDQKNLLKLEDKIYETIKLKQFGWINCDIFYESPNKTDIQFVFRDMDSITCANVYLLFKDINSVMQSYYFSLNKEMYNSGFKNIPVGAKTELIAVSLKNGRIYSYKNDLTIISNMIVELALNKTTDEQIENLFSRN